MLEKPQYYINCKYDYYISLPVGLIEVFAVM